MAGFGVSDDQIADRKEYPGDRLYFNPATNLYEWNDEPENAFAAGLIALDALAADFVVYPNPDMSDVLVIEDSPFVTDGDTPDTLTIYDPAPVAQSPSAADVLVIG